MVDKYIKDETSQTDIQKVKDFLNLQNYVCESVTVKDNIKEMCVEKLCRVVGIKCKCNYQNKFFNYFSSVTGEAVCQLLKIPIIVAEDNFRLIKYNHINLVEYVKSLLQDELLEEAFIDIFQFLDNLKGLVGIN